LQYFIYIFLVISCESGFLRLTYLLIGTVLPTISVIGNFEMDYKSKRIAILSPVAWRTPPRKYGAWETIAGNICEGLVARGWKDVTIFATKDSITKAKLHAIIEKGYEEDEDANSKVCEILHISEIMEMSDQFDLIHNNFDFIPLTFSRLIKTPILTTIHGFSSPKILPVYRKYKDGYYVSISDSDRDPELPYLATVYNGINLDELTVGDSRGDKLVFLGRIDPDKGTHLACETAKKAGMELIIAGIIQNQDYFDNLVKPHIDGKQIKFIGSVGPAERDALFKEAYAVLHLNELPERFGLVMAEANGAGVPVIAYDRGSCREVIADGKTGFLVTNVDEAAHAIKKIDQIDPHVCRKHVEDNFSIDCMASGYEKVYEEIFKREQAKK
jgi:glycosyltransferase involved in cell wall biosynthesis